MQQAQRTTRSRILLLVEILAFAELYFCCGTFGLSLAIVNESASAVWPPTGVALATLLLRGSRLWPGIFLGAFAVNFVVQGSVATALPIALGNTLEAVMAAWLVRRFADGCKAFERTKSIFRFVLLAAVFSTIVSSTLGVLTLCLGGHAPWSDFGAIWLTWWSGDTVSDLIIAPLLLVWFTKGVPQLKPLQVLEGMALLLMLTWIGQLVFLGQTPFGPRNYPLEYLAIVPLLWAAFRFQEIGAITSAFVMSAIAIWGTRRGFGPFSRPDPNESLLLLQTFMGTITVSTLVLASIISEQKRAELRLQIQDAVSRVLAEAPTLRAATPRIFQALSEKGGWEAGGVWACDKATQELFSVGVWHLPSLEFSEFLSLSRRTRFPKGLGLPGRVLSSGMPVWVADVTKDSNFPRAAAAAKEGLHGAICFPLKLGEEVVGVIECFSREVREPDEEFLLLLANLGNQLGQFIERKRVEEAQARLAAIVETSEDAIIGKSLEGKITNWNEGAQRVYGYTAAEATGQDISLIVPPDRAQEEHRILERIRCGERFDHYETSRVRKDGGLIDVSLSVSPMKDASGVIVGASSIARDITEQKKIERALGLAQEELRHYAGDLEARVQERTVKLRETIQSLDGFCYSIAHDLRAPLRALSGFSSQLSDAYAELLDETGKEHLRRIQAAAARMDQLIRDLLQLGRLNTAALPATTVPLEETVQRVLAPLQGAVDARHGKVRLREPLLAVQANPVMVEQVLVNLLDNALKFVPAKASPEVEIWTEPRDSMVRVCVRDNGIGIKPEYLNKLFQPFVRLTNGADYPGTGIGLAIVRKGVERMGGYVGVDSQPGEGSCFWIELPAAADSNSSPSQSNQTKQA